MFGAVSNACQSYYNDLPDNTLQTVGKSAIFTFSLGFILVIKPGEPPNISRPLAMAGIAGFASLIHSLTNPIFNKIFGDNDLRMHREIIKFIVNMAITSTLVMYITTGKVDFTVFQWFGGYSMNCFLGIGNEVPILLDWVGSVVNPNFNPQDPANIGNIYRRTLSRVGLNVVPGAGSVYLLR